MSPKMGSVNLRESNTSPFLGTATPRPSGDAHSEATRRDVDLEIKRIIDECMETALDVLSRRREVLEHMTRDLIDMEVMNADQLNAILASYKTGPQLKPGTFVDKTGAVDDDATAEAGEADLGSTGSA